LTRIFDSNRRTKKKTKQNKTKQEEETKEETTKQPIQVLITSFDLNCGI